MPSNVYDIKFEPLISSLESPDKTLNFAPVATIYNTDKYLDVNYMFWNVNLIRVSTENQIISRIKPNEKYIFHTKFLINYESFKMEWLIQFVLSSIVTVIAFIGGALWGRKKK